MVPTAGYRSLDYEEIAQTLERLHTRISELLGAVDEIETLTTGLSGKIWQKIQLLDSRRVAV